MRAFLCLLAMTVLFLTAFGNWMELQSRSSEALLPGTPGGHPLFGSLPVCALSDVVWSPCDHPSQSPAAETLDLFDDDQDPVHRACLQYMQRAQSSFTAGKGLHAIATIADQHSSHDITVGVDALSDVNMAAREHLRDIRGIEQDSARGTGGISRFTEEGSLHVEGNGTVVSVPALVATRDRLPRGCCAVLGMPAISDLGINLSAQRDAPKSELQCFLGEKSLRAWLEGNEGASVDTKPLDLQAIAINPDLPPEMIDRVRKLLVKFAAVFYSSSGTLPKPFNAEPVELNLRPDAQPQSIPEPRWTHALRTVIEKWALDGLANGSLEHSKSCWASRPHVVLKAPSGQRAEDAIISDCKLRVCGDYRLVNAQIAKLTPNLPTGTNELEKASGHSNTAHYLGSTHNDLTRAKFLPCWHPPNTDVIRRSALQPPNMVPYTSDIDIEDSLDVLLVTRGLLLTTTEKLRAKSQRLLAPFLDELFIY
jgi:hypothetical protein